MALANVAEYFYRKGLRVVMIDWDLEAPGLESFYFNSRDAEGQEELKRIRSQLGLIDMILAYKRLFPNLQFPTESANVSEQISLLSGHLNPIRHHLYPIHPPESLPDRPEAALWLMQAGWREGDRFPAYSQAVQSFDWTELYDSYKGKVFFEWMRNEVDAMADVVLIDSRTGVTEMGGVCTRQLADVVVSFSVLNNQNMEGVAKMMNSFKRDEVIKARDGRPIEAIVIPTRIDTTEIDARAVLFDAFERIMDPLPPQFEQVNTTYQGLGIPYISKYAYFERLAIGANDRVVELQNAYKTLATHLALLAPVDSVLRTKLADDLEQVLRVTASPVPCMAPALPSALVERPAEIAKLKEALPPLPNAHQIAQSGTQQQPVVLYGPPGSGKSTLAAAFAREGDVIESFKDGILWVTLGAYPDITALMTLLYAKLTGDSRRFESEDEVVRQLTAKLFDKLCLIVIDDLCGIAHLRPFANLGNRSSYLITTRDPSIVPSAIAKQIQIERFSDAQALELVATASKFPQAHRDVLSQFVSRLSRRPLALKLAGDMLRQRIEIVGDEPLNALEYANRILTEKGVTAFDKPDTPDRNQSVAKSIAASLGLLTPAELERYVQLALALDRKKLTVDEVIRLWSTEYGDANSGSHALNAEERLQHLHALSLIKYDVKSGTVELDATVRSHVIAELPSDVGLHLRAESIFSKLSPDEQVTAKRVLIRLVKLGRPGTAEEDVRSRVSFRNLDEPSKNIVKSFLDGRVLTQEEDRLTKEQKVQFADESLIKKWSRLRQWLAGDDREFMYFFQQIRPNFNAWNAGQADALLSGEELASAKKWKDRSGLDRTLSTYINLSIETNRRQILKRVVQALVWVIILALIVGYMAWTSNQTRRAAEDQLKQQQQAHLKLVEGDIAAAQREYDKAIQLYGEAFLGSAEPALVYYSRGKALRAKESYDYAVADFNEAIRLDSNLTPAYLERGLARMKLGDTNGALEDFRTTTQLSGNGSDVETAKAYIDQLSPRIGPTPTVSPTPVPAAAAVYIRYEDKENSEQIVFIQNALLKQGYSVKDVQLAAPGFKPQVKYYYDEDAANARAVRSIVISSLKGLHFPANVIVGKVSKPGNAKRGQIEVWLASLQ
jgi:tetratricopeptide (TPR) repeat protein